MHNSNETLKNRSCRISKATMCPMYYVHAQGWFSLAHKHKPKNKHKHKHKQVRTQNISIRAYAGAVSTNSSIPVFLDYNQDGG